MQHSENDSSYRQLSSSRLLGAARLATVRFRRQHLVFVTCSCNFFVQRHVNNIRLIIIIIIITPPPANFYPGYIPQKTIPWVIPRFFWATAREHLSTVWLVGDYEKKGRYIKKIFHHSPQKPPFPFNWFLQKQGRIQRGVAWVRLRPPFSLV